MGIHDEAKLDVKFIAFAKQMNLYLNHFPSHEKFGLSQVIRCKAYEIYGLVVESQKRYQKKTSLTHLDVCHEQLRMLLRLAPSPQNGACLNPLFPSSATPAAQPACATS